MLPADHAYGKLIERVILHGRPRSDRTGTGTISCFGPSCDIPVSHYSATLTCKKILIKPVIAELCFFLSGSTELALLKDYGCNFWDDNQKDAYEKGIVKVGDLGPIYGSQWRNFLGVDQVKSLVDGLINNPYGRRHIVSAWNPADIPDMTLPPCHVMWQCYVQNGKLSLLMYQRSADIFLGVPFNFLSYYLILKLLCILCGYEPDMLMFRYGDAHIYSNHVKQVDKVIDRLESKYDGSAAKFEIPSAEKLRERHDEEDYVGLCAEYLKNIKPSDFIVTDYKSLSWIKAPMAV